MKKQNSFKSADDFEKPGSSKKINTYSFAVLKIKGLCKDNIYKEQKTIGLNVIVKDVSGPNGLIEDPNL